MKKLIAVSTVMLLASCASRYPILSSPLVSMTKYSFSDGQLAELGPVEAKYCQGDRAHTSTSHNVGLIDEAIFKAQQKMGADYISNAMISAEGSCVVIEGMAVKKVAVKTAAYSKKKDRSPAGADVDDVSDFAVQSEN